MRLTKKQAALAGAIAVAWVTSLMVVSVFANVSVSSPLQFNNQYVLAKPCIYYVFTDGTDYYAQNCNNGNIDYGQGGTISTTGATDFGALLNVVIPAIFASSPATSVGGSGTLAIGAGTFTFATGILVDYKPLYTNPPQVGNIQGLTIKGAGMGDTILTYTGSGIALNVTNTKVGGAGVSENFVMSGLGFNLGTTVMSAVIAFGNQHGSASQAFYPSVSNVYVKNGLWTYCIESWGTIDGVFDHVVCDRQSDAAGTALFMRGQSNVNTFIGGQYAAAVGINLTSGFGNSFIGVSVEKATAYGVWVYTGASSNAFYDIYTGALATNCLVDKAGDNVWVNPYTACTPQITFSGTLSPFTTANLPQESTTSLTFVMAGFGGTATFTQPYFAGTLIVSLTVDMSNNLQANGCDVGELLYGTGTAPTSGAAVSGTPIAPYNTGGNIYFRHLQQGSGDYVSYTYFAHLNVAAQGTSALWFDIAFKAVTGGTCTLNNGSNGEAFSVIELPNVVENRY